MGYYTFHIFANFQKLHEPTKILKIIRVTEPIFENYILRDSLNTFARRLYLFIVVYMLLYICLYVNLYKTTYKQI